MTENRLLAVRNATTETIDHLHDSLESCPSEDTAAPDPGGIKVSQLRLRRCLMPSNIHALNYTAVVLK